MPRIVKIGTTGYGVALNRESSFNLAVELMRGAGAAGGALALLPESLLYDDDGGACLDPALVQRMHGRLQELAAEYGMYILAGLPLWEGNPQKLYTSATLFGRTGEVEGIYRKIHPTESEMDQGVVAGTDPGIFDLDFGRIGVLICFDVGWPDEWRKLRDLGAELVCWLSFYDGGLPLQAYAWTHKYYVVTSVRGKTACFIDMTGMVMDRTTQWTQLAIRDLNLDRKVFHVDWNKAKIPAMMRDCGGAIEIHGYQEEGYFTLEPKDDSVSIDDLIQQYGLETYEAYHARVTRLQDATRL